MNSVAIGTALINACGQSLALLLLTLIVVKTAQRSSAAARCAVWNAAIVLMLVLPFADIAAALRPASIAPAQLPPTHARSQAAMGAPSGGVHAVSRSAAVLTPQRARYGAMADSGIAAGSSDVAGAKSLPKAALSWIDEHGAGVRRATAAPVRYLALPLALAWPAGALIFSLQLVFGYTRMRALKRSMVSVTLKTLGLRISNAGRRCAVGLSGEIPVPCVLGYARPVIALPAELLGRVSRTDLERIVLHESAHVQRFDDVAHLLQRIVQSVFWLNPAVHIAAHKANLEREVACDDWAAARFPERVRYAQCVHKIAAGKTRNGYLLPAPGFFLNGKQLLARIERLLERQHNGATRLSNIAIAAVCGFIIIGLGVGQLRLLPPADDKTVNARTAATAGAAVRNRPVPAPTRTASGTLVVVRAMRYRPGATPQPPSTARSTPVLATIATVAKRTPPKRPAAAAHGTATASPGHIVAAPAHAVAASIEPAGPPAPRLPTIKPSAAASLMHVEVSAYQTPDMASAEMTNSTMTSTTVTTVEVGRGQTNGAEAAASVAVAGVPQGPSPSARSSANDFLGQLAAAGYTNLCADDLIALHNAGVSGRLISALRHAGVRDASIKELIALSEHGITPGYIAQLASRGYAKLTAQELMDLRDQGISAAYISSLQRAGYAQLSPDELIALRQSGAGTRLIAKIKVRTGNRVINPSTDIMLRLHAAGI